MRAEASIKTAIDTELQYIHKEGVGTVNSRYVPRTVIKENGRQSIVQPVAMNKQEVTAGSIQVLSEILQEVRAAILPDTADIEDKRGYLPSLYPAITSSTFPTINPPKVPKIYPIIAIRTPMGMSALE